MGILTMKFGGSTVGTTTALPQVVSIILQESERWEHLVIVVSALDGVTDALIEAAHLAQLGNRRGYRRIVATLRTRHLALVEQLPLKEEERGALKADIDHLLFDMLDVCQTLSEPTSVNLPVAEYIDAIIGVGERLSARVIAALLRQNGIRGVALDAFDLIITDEIFGNANPDFSRTRERVKNNLMPLLERNLVPVITGFIGSTPSGKPTTLGRGGSDFTASLLAVCTESSEVWIWADVDGMMSADPRDIDDAHVIDELSYTEVAELTYFGARILHTRMVAPLREQNIPLCVKNVFKPQRVGTRIHANAPDFPPQIKAITSSQSIGLTTTADTDLGLLLDVINKSLQQTIGGKPDVLMTAQSPNARFVCFVVPTSAGPDALRTISLTLEGHLQENDLHWSLTPVSIITTIGTRLNDAPRLWGDIFVALDDISILAISQGATHCSLSVVVAPHDADRALRRIHGITQTTQKHKLPAH
jgi:aspartate kinase